MSNQARRRRHRPPRRVDPERVRAGTAISSAILGCTCEPTITLSRHHGVEHAHVEHDDGCPAIDGGSHLAVWLRPPSAP